jgi:hypothetical protein
MFPRTTRWVESTNLRLWQQKVSIYPTKNIPPRIPPKRALRLERLQQRRPGKRKDKVEAPTGRCGERHPRISDVNRKRFRRVCKRHRALTGRVHGHEQENSRGDTSQATLRLRRTRLDPEGEAGEQETGSHEREGGEK